MTAPELLTRAQLDGVQLWAEAGQLRYRGAAPLLSPLLPELRRLKPELLDLLESAPVHRWASATTGETSATAAAAPDDAASAMPGSAAAMAPGDDEQLVIESTIAPDVLPQLPQGEGAALLARYRAGGAVLTLEMVEHDGTRSLALGVELTSRVAPEKRARAFTKITAHGLEMVRALELENAPTIDGGAAALLYAPDDLMLIEVQATSNQQENQTL